MEDDEPEEETKKQSINDIFGHGSQLSKQLLGKEDSDSDEDPSQRGRRGGNARKMKKMMQEYNDSTGENQQKFMQMMME